MRTTLIAWGKNKRSASSRAREERGLRRTRLECLEARTLLTAYYVDFLGGSDAANGLSPITPFQHAPGTGGPTVALQGGDTVIFKGGAHYRGTVTAKYSGTAAAPITYDGNSAGTFGTGPAIIDGSELLSGWTPVTSSASVGDNSKWQSIYKATYPAGLDPLALNLYQDNQLLTLAQGPNLTDPMYYDDTDTYRSVPASAVTSTTLQDSGFFKQGDSAYWNGAYLRIWVSPNVVETATITGFSPGSNTITFSPSQTPYTTTNTLYAVANHFSVLDLPGEYVVDAATRSVYLYSLTAPDPNQSEITVSTRRVGFDFSGKSNVVVQGFVIEKQAAPLGAWGYGVGIRNTAAASNLVVRNNEITRNLSMEKYGAIYLSNVTGGLIQNNIVHHNVRNRGMLIGSSSNINVDHNTLDKNGGTGIYFGGVANGTIQYNTVLNHRGVHANGITLYQGSTDCLVLGNTVLDGRIALTSEDSFRLTFAYNVLGVLAGDSDNYTVAEWGGGSDLHYYNNVMMNDYAKAFTVSSSSRTNLEIRNNIMDGNGVNTPGPNITNNIYTSLVWNQQARYGWYLGAGEMTITNKSAIFVDPANRDYHLKSTAAAINAGAALALTSDHDGNPLVGLPDIGAYEYNVHAPAMSTMPLQLLQEGSTRLHAIDLWSYAADAESPDSALTFTIFSATNPDAGVSIEGNRYLNIVPRADWYGTSDVTIRASDGALVGSSTLRVTVNHPPTPFTGGPYVVGIGSSVNLVGSALDRDGTVASYAWDFNYSGSTFQTSATTATAAFSAAGLAAGTRTVALKVTDNNGGSTTATAVLTIRGPVFIGTGAADVFLVRTVGGTVQFFENQPTSGPPAFSIPTSLAGTIGVSGGAAADTLTIESGSFTLDADLGGLSLTCGAAVQVASSQHLSALTLLGGAGLNMAASATPRVLRVGSVLVDPTARLDLANNAMIVDYPVGVSPLSAIGALIGSGYSGGTWLGKGIASSSAAADSSTYTLGVLDNAARPTPLGSFAGELVSASTILIRLTYTDDLDLDGRVTSNDAIALANNYADGQAATHQTGDLNYNGVFDSNDAILFANSYNESLTPLASFSASTATSLAVVAETQTITTKPHKQPGAKKKPTFVGP